MSFIKEHRENGLYIKITGALTVYEIESLHTELLNSFNSADTMFLNLAEVSDCDVSGIQLIISAIRTIEKSNKSISITDVSLSINNAFSLCGINPADIFRPNSNKGK
ncbi:MAG: STAS domain-containing protein [Desulfobacterales bacterium]|nr:STAS domain-containing protein [Desulfobacterales bacterium]MBF0395385.1 STAS domain-containing protein [Desulfobacterales bacterium]